LAELTFDQNNFSPNAISSLKTFTSGPYYEKIMTIVSETFGLYYKGFMIVNYATVWSLTYDHSLRS